MLVSFHELTETATKHCPMSLGQVRWSLVLTEENESVPYIRIIQRVRALSEPQSTSLTSKQIFDAIYEDDILSQVIPPSTIFVLFNGNYCEMTIGSDKVFSLEPGADENVFEIQVERNMDGRLPARRIVFPITMAAEGPHSINLKMLDYPTYCHVRYFDYLAEGWVRVKTGIIPSTCIVDGQFKLLVEHLDTGTQSAAQRSDHPVVRRRVSGLKSSAAMMIDDRGSAFQEQRPSPRQAQQSQGSATTNSNIPAASIPAPPTKKVPYFASCFSQYVDVVQISQQFPAIVEMLEKRDEVVWAKAAPLPTDREKFNGPPWKALIRGGVPAMYRDSVWSTLTGAAQTLSQRPNTFSNAVERTFKWEHLLEKFPEFSPTAPPMFGRGAELTTKSGLGADGLQASRIIACLVAEYFPEVDYCPMLPCIIEMLLIHCKPAFVTAAVFNLISSSKVVGGTHHLRLTFEGHAVQLKVFDLLVRKRAPNLSRFFEGKRINICEIAHIMYTTMFSNVLSLYHALQIFDAYLNEGSKILHRFSTTLLVTYERFIMTCTTMDEIISIMRTQCEQDDMDALWKAAYAWSFSRKDMESLEKTIDSQIAKTCLNRPTPVPMLLSRPRIRTPSAILQTPMLWEDIFAWCSTKTLCSGELWGLYSSEQHGWSLHTLYTKCADIHNPVIMLLHVRPKSDNILAKSVNDVQSPLTSQRMSASIGGATASPALAKRSIIGAYLSHAPQKPIRTTDEKFTGNGSCFVFTISPQAKHYESSSLNQNYILTKPNSMLIGCGGGGSAISLPVDFHSGTTNACTTFNSPPLLPTEQFHILQLEVYEMRS